MNLFSTNRSNRALECYVLNGKQRFQTKTIRLKRLSIRILPDFSKCKFLQQNTWKLS